MISILPDETVITDGDRHPVLEITWRINSRIGLATVTVHLDSSMYAIPPEHHNGSSVTVTYGPPSVSFPRPDYSLSENRRIITFQVHAFSLKNTTGNLQRKRIPFEWRNPGCIPNTIELDIATDSSSCRKYHLIGFNIEKNIIEFVKRRNDSTFYFPRQLGISAIPYWEFSKDAALYQSIPNTTVMSVTWPLEWGYWKSKEGEDYLISQIRKLKHHQPTTVPVRIAICPLELETPAGIARPFLEEMESHSRLGIEIRVISPRSLEDVIKEKTSIALYGNALGLEFQGTDADLSAGGLSLMLDSHRIKDLSAVYRELYQSSVPWAQYRKEKDLSFSDEESGIRIFNRIRNIVAHVE